MESPNSDSSVAAAMVALVKCSAEGQSSNLMRTYLDKLKELVPHCPKNRDVSKLELIQHVIDYINDLQDTLQSGSDTETPPSSPQPDPLSFTEAFSHLNFSEDALRDLKRCVPSSEDVGVTYTSDGSSDYGSRGSSPISHHSSDGDYSSDEFSGSIHPLCTHNPSILYSHPLNNSGAYVTAGPSTMSSFSPTNDPYRHFYRKDYYGLPVYHNNSP